MVDGERTREKLVVTFVAGHSGGCIWLACVCLARFDAADARPFLRGLCASWTGCLQSSLPSKGGAPAPRWWLAIVGISGIAAGLLTFLMPGISALVLLLFIAGWAIATGVFQIIGAVKLRKEIDNEWLLILNGVISVLFGVGMMLAPGAGALALVWLIAIYSVIAGALLIGLAIRLKKHSHA
jgi:uncharacterized membrane protein HdeD (DUF308 family)